MAKGRGGGLVYSTDKGRICPGCRRAQAECVCNDRSRARPGGAGDGAVIVSRESKGRKGAGVTLIRGLPLADKDLAALTRKLKFPVCVRRNTRRVRYIIWPRRVAHQRSIEELALIEERALIEGVRRDR